MASKDLGLQNKNASRLVSTRSLRGRIKSEFPKHTLEDALRVPRALADVNAGRPLPPVETAVALKLSPGSSTLRSLLAAAIAYGLTEGSYSAERVAMTNTARAIVEATSEDEGARTLVDAALTPTTFRKLYDYFKGKKLPDPAFFANALVRDFDIPREHAQICIDVFTSNMHYAGLIRQTKVGSWLSTDTLSVGGPSAGVAQADIETPSPVEETSSDRPTNGHSASHNAIFVAHGRNQKPLEQLKQILDQYQIPHKVAVDEPNRGRPISQKVADLMHECGAAILIFTADQEFRDAIGHVLWKPSDNVVYELGAASALYGGKIIIFKEQGVDFATNYRDIGYIEFEKDALANKTNELFRELIAFGLIRVTVGT